MIISVVAGCCRPTKLFDTATPTKFKVNDIEVACIQACTKAAECIAYEINPLRENMCEHFNDDKFAKVQETFVDSKSCRSTVCGSKDFLVPWWNQFSNEFEYVAPTPAPTCPPATTKGGLVYKPMDNDPAFCKPNCKRCGKKKKKCRTVEVSAEACFARCDATDGCIAINYWADGGCHLAGHGAKGAATKADIITFTRTPTC